MDDNDWIDDWANEKVKEMAEEFRTPMESIDFEIEDVGDRLFLDIFIPTGHNEFTLGELESLKKYLDEKYGVILHSILINRSKKRVVYVVRVIKNVIAIGDEPFTEFAWNKRLGYIGIGDFFAQGDDYYTTLEDAGIDMMDSDEEAEEKLVRYLKSAGWQF